MAHNPEPKPSTDVALVVGRVDDGLAIVRKRSVDAPLEMGVVRELREGAPIHGEVVALSSREGSPVLDVRVQYAPSAPTSAPEAPLAGEAPTGAPARGKGPAKVATSEYRTGWDQVFGKKLTN